MLAENPAFAPNIRTLLVHGQEGRSLGKELRWNHRYRPRKEIERWKAVLAKLANCRSFAIQRHREPDRSKLDPRPAGPLTITAVASLIIRIITEAQLDVVSFSLDCRPPQSRHARVPFSDRGQDSGAIQTQGPLSTIWSKLHELTMAHLVTEGAQTGFLPRLTVGTQRRLRRLDLSGLEADPREIKHLFATKYDALQEFRADRVYWGSDGISTSFHGF
ncbi:uncharacterized protein BJX67DRAFT_229664 [Aspergillus lucknowensis]|uniref:Uncharacterized protein n=1 Tax=Aspergillus lucknowensis TaxID=176173 RepID=A0ABR4LHI2_9EURO